MPMRMGEMGTETVLLYRAIAGERADRYASEMLLGPLGRLLSLHSPSIAEMREALLDPFECLRVFFGHYAFSRRGKDRQILSELALDALEEVAGGDRIGQFLSLDDGFGLWQAFENRCRENRIKSNEQQNRGVIQGTAELAQEVSRIGLRSIADWVRKAVAETDRMEPQFLRIVDIRGVGPKITSQFLRDLTYLFGLEERIERADRIYIQPIDKWIRALAPYVVPEPNAEGMADWVLAGKLNKYSRWAGVSPVRFNMGATYFGAREVHDVEHMARAVAEVIAGASPVA
ncbi:MAG: hypothetical protein N2109_03585 [Fimbriimonadales bacterium]|nr:hypothetical protein [Fimbriimonadales bacterium]